MAKKNICKRDNRNTRIAKKSFNKKHRSRYNKKARILRSSSSQPIHKIKLSSEINRFYQLNSSKEKKDYKTTINLTSDFNLFDNPDKILAVLIKLIHNARDKHTFMQLNYRGGLGFGALYFIDMICWEIAKSRKWLLKMGNLPECEKEILQNLKSFRTSESDNENSYIINRKIKINRTDELLAKQEHNKKSKEIRDLVERGLREVKNDPEYKLPIEKHGAIDSAISEHFDNILLHAIEAEFGFIAGLFNKSDQSLSILIYNFGPTINETLRKPDLPIHVKEFNAKILKNHSKKNLFALKTVFNQENALTLLAIQEGISSKLDKDISRGHGLIDYIEKCFEISNDTKITIISGKTAINIDSKYKISHKNIMNRNRKILAFNDENNIYSKPDSNYVKSIKHTFPGVLISTTIPLT